MNVCTMHWKVASLKRVAQMPIDVEIWRCLWRQRQQQQTSGIAGAGVHVDQSAPNPLIIPYFAGVG